MSVKHADAGEIAACQRGNTEFAEYTGGSGDESRTLELDKSWHVLHYLFTGSAWEGALPAAMLLSGGAEAGPDLGYGPARVISAADTAAFARFLAGQSADSLCARIDTAQMQSLEIYCAGDDDDASVEIEEDIQHYFPQLQSHVTAAAQRGCGLIIWLS